MPDSTPPFIDTHVHLWDRSKFRYPWLDAPECEPIRGDYRIEDLAADADGLEARGFVHLQADVERAIDPVEETAWLESQVAQAPEGFPPMVYIGYADLRANDLPDVLARHAEYDRVRGIRQEVWYHPGSDLPGVLDVNLLEDDAWKAGLRRLADHDMVFDLLVAADQLGQAATIFRELDDIPVVLEHTGVPSGTDDPTLEPWRRGMRQFAEEVPHALLKISGMNFIVEEWEVPQLTPIVSECLEIFGPHRCVFASNFPVERSSTIYRELWEAYSEMTADLSASERAAVFHDNALRAYRVDA